MPGVKGFPTSQFPQIRVKKDIHEIIRKLRTILNYESMEMVIVWLLIRSDDAKMKFRSYSQEDVYYKKLMELSDGNLYEVNKEPIDKATERIKDAVARLSYELQHGNKVLVELELRQLISRWNEDNPYKRIELCSDQQLHF